MGVPRSVHLKERLGGKLDAHAAMDRDEFVTICCDKPAIHRFPGSMGKRIWTCAPSSSSTTTATRRIWNRVPSGDELYRACEYGLRRREGQDLHGDPREAVRQAAGRLEGSGGPFSDSQPRSVADVADAATLAQVREWKKAKKAAAKTKQD